MNLVDEGLIALVISRDLLAEVRDVLTRPKLTQKFTSLSPERVEQFLANVEAHAELVSDVPRTIKFPRNPKDEPYINLAVASRARYLVTRDKNLLDLIDDEALQ